MNIDERRDHGYDKRTPFTPTIPIEGGSPIARRNKAMIAATLGDKLPEILGEVLRAGNELDIRESQVEAIIRTHLGKGPEEEIEVVNPDKRLELRGGFPIFVNVVRYEAFRDPAYWRGEIARVKAERENPPQP